MLQGYTCDSELDTRTLRRLNAAADEGATAALLTALWENGGEAHAANFALVNRRSLTLFGYGATVASLVERAWTA